MSVPAPSRQEAGDILAAYSRRGPERRSQLHTVSRRMFQRTQSACAVGGRQTARWRSMDRSLAHGPERSDDRARIGEQKCACNVEHALLAKCRPHGRVTRRQHNDSCVQAELPDFLRLEEPIVFPCRVVQEHECHSFSEFRSAKAWKAKWSTSKSPSICALTADSVALSPVRTALVGLGHRTRPDAPVVRTEKP